MLTSEPLLIALYLNDSIEHELCNSKNDKISSYVVKNSVQPGQTAPSSLNILIKLAVCHFLPTLNPVFDKIRRIFNMYFIAC